MNPNQENLAALQQEVVNQVEESDQSKAEEAHEEEEVKQGYDILKTEELDPLGFCKMYRQLKHLAGINIIYLHSSSPIVEPDDFLTLHQILEVMFHPQSDLP